MKLLRSILLLALVPAALFARVVSPATATLTPDSAYLLPSTGTVTFTAAVSGYTNATSAIGWSVTLPAGWSYVSGTGEPDVKPAAGQTGTLEWAYISIPESASFTFTISYPAGIVADASIASAVIVRASGFAQTTTPAAVTLSPATAPVVANTGSTSATFASTLSLQISATSPIAITGYGATGLPTGLLLDGATGLIAGAPTQVGTFPVSLTATNAAGTSAAASISLVVGNASASLVLGSLAATYDGQPHAATATTTPANLNVVLLYGAPGSSTAPTDAGTYPISASIASLGYTASASGSLVISPADQTVTFTPVGAVQAGSDYPLSAGASSSLPVTFSVVSGPATIAGSTLTVNASGAIVLRASQAGNNNYHAASADQTLNASKLSQTITFPQPADKIATDAAFALAATASSGLPVSFTVISGPAMLAGSTLTLTGSSGTVAIRASQAGNLVYTAATDVTRTFEVTADQDRVFFGNFFSNGASLSASRSTRGASTVALVGDIAAVLPAQSNDGSLMIVAPTVGINILVPFTLHEDGSFVSTTTQTIAGVSRSVTVRGQLANNVLSGSVDELGYSFSTAVEPHTGPSAAASGLYKSTALATSEGVTYTIVGANNNVLVLAITPTVTVGGPATLAGDGTFQLEVAAPSGGGQVTLKGTVDEPTTTVASSITLPNQAPIDFGGLKTTTSRTDRLINLSSRARVGSGENVLITGFVLGGSTSKQVLVRAIGPGLSGLGVQSFLANPSIRIERSGVLVAQNDDWGANTDPAALAAVAARIGAFAIASGSKDASLLATLEPGVYTAVVSGGTGVALAEIYDASENPQADYQRLVNISSRGEVTSGENILIGGFVVTGNSPKKIMIRGVGPGLAAQGVAHPLGDPALKIYKSNTLLAQNDNWSSDATAAAELASAATTTGAFALQSGSKDAAIILTLTPGIYSVHVVGNAGTTGVALVEIYEVPE